VNVLPFFGPTRQLTLPAFVTALALVAASSLAQASAVYVDNFAGGSTTGWTLPSYSSIASLPTDSGGLASVNQASWLKIDSQAAKTVDETASLSLSGLQVGHSYTVAADLFIGGSWDGSAGYYGPDELKLVVNQPGDAVKPLLDATFANGQQGINFGADSRQSYSDAQPVAGTGLLYDRFTGADASFSLNQGGNYGSDYSIYHFSHGVGNPTLSFVATGSTATLVFQRVGIPSGDSGDEYWGVRNVSVSSVSAVPEPSSAAMLLAGGVVVVFLRPGRSRRRDLPTQKTAP
jgi:hypothetical protein